MDEPENILSNCRVKLEGLEHTYEGDSGVEGVISFEDIGNDTYKLTVEKDGYEPFVEEGIVIDEKNKTLNAKVSLKKKSEEITLILLTKPEVESAQITIYDADGVAVFHGKTDAEGTISFKHVKYGSYALKADKTGYTRYAANIKVNSTNNNPRTIEIPLEEETV